MEPLHTRTFSPQELARALSVSESSIRRWVDEGRIDATRTAGGHRRIVMRDALRFIRSQGMRVLRPELLGLPDFEGMPAGVRDGLLTGELLYQLLRRGDTEQVRGLLTSSYLSGTSVADLMDGPVAELLARVDAGALQEGAAPYLARLASSVCVEAVNQLRLLVDAPEADAPMAVGGAPAGDPYLLPSLMAAAALAEAGYREVNLGPDTPVPAFLHAVATHQPALAWVAARADVAAAQAEVLSRELIRPLLAEGVGVVLVGAPAEARRDVWPAGAHVVATMRALADASMQHKAAVEGA